MAMIETRREATTVVITINNPPMNVLCTELLRQLDKALDDIASDNSVRAVVITGEGRAFVAGADIKEMMDMDPKMAEEFASLGQGVLSKIEALPVPVIAAVNGYALGGGTELAMACDIRIASEAARFGQPEVNLGVIPGFGGTQRLPRLIGAGKAKELIYTGDIISAEEALRIGLVQRVVEGYKRDENGNVVKDEKGRKVQDNGPVLQAALELSEKIGSKGLVAIRHAKRAINEGLDMPLKDGLSLEGRLFSSLFETYDQKEGMRAFVEKREARFEGR